MAGLRAGKGEVRMPGSFFFLRFLQALDLALDHQFFIATERHAMLLGKALRAFSDKIDMRALVKHQARGLYGVANAFDTADAAGAQGGAIHHESVKLHAAVASEKAAAAGVKSFVIFH